VAYKYNVNAISYVGDAHNRIYNCFFVDGVTPVADGVCNGADIETKCKGKKHLFSVFSGKSEIDRVCNRLDDMLTKKSSKKIRSKVQFELKNVMEEISQTFCKNDNDSTMSTIYIDGNNVYASGHGDMNIYKFSKKSNRAKKIEFPLYTPLNYEAESNVAVKLRQPARAKCIGKVSSGDEFLLADSNLVSILGDDIIMSTLKEYGKNAPAKLIELASNSISAYNLTAVHICAKRRMSPLYFILPLILIAALGTYYALVHITPQNFKTDFLNGEPETTSVQAPNTANSNNNPETSPPKEEKLETDILPVLAPLSAKLDIIGSEVTGEKSIVSYYIKDLSTGEVLENNNSSMSSASLIKLYIMAEIYRQIDAQEIDMTEEIKKLLHEMITKSDNDASNELAKIAGGGDMKLGFKKITNNAKSLGCVDTIQENDLQAVRTEPVKGKNTTSVRDCGLLLEMIYNKTLVSEEYSSEMLELLKQQTRLEKIPKYIRNDVVVANKTGETTIAQNDVGIVFVKDRPYIICIMINNYENQMDEAMEIIAKMSKATYDFFINLKEPQILSVP